MQVLTQGVDLKDANFVLNLTQAPTAQLPRPGMATVQDFYQTPQGSFEVRKNISATSFCHAYNVWSRNKRIEGICLQEGTDQETFSQTTLDALRSENYCSIRATRLPFVVHLLPVHRARNQIGSGTAGFRDCGFVHRDEESEENARMLQDFPVDGYHIENSLKYYDLRRFMYQRYITILDAKLRDKTQWMTEHSQSPLEKVLGFAPALLEVIDSSKFRPGTGCLDENLNSTGKQCFSSQDFGSSYDRCGVNIQNSVLYFLHKEMHCPQANSTQKLLETVVNNAVAAVQNNMPTFIDDPEVVAIDNPCQQSTSEVQVSINRGAWLPIANFSQAQQVTWQGSPQILHVMIKTVDGECAFKTSVAVNATQRGIAFVDKSTTGECGADMEHAREFAVALQRFDALVAVAT